MDKKRKGVISFVCKQKFDGLPSGPLRAMKCVKSFGFRCMIGVIYWLPRANIWEKVRWVTTSWDNLL